MEAGRERLLTYFEARVVRGQGCWSWRGHIDKNGYGWASVGHRLYHSTAHRLAYELLVEPIPEGLQLDHLCRNPGCVNPAHLEPVTIRENVLRGIGPTAIAARRDTCALGHPLTGENLRIKHDGVRRCRICQRAQNRKDKRAAKERANVA